MSDIYSIASAGLLDGQKRLETISQNAANASVTGFRRQVAAARSFPSNLVQTAAPGQGIDSKETGSALRLRVDLRPGTLVATGRALDVAIEGDDLFFALTDGVQTWLTRAGAFRLSPDGMLVGERGLRVQGVGGDIKLDNADVDIRPDGQIVRDGVAVAALQLFKPNDRATLEHAGGALIRAAQGVLPAEPGAGRVRASTLETSNAGASTEMVDLLALTRQFESLVRVLQGYDELLGRAIQRLGEV
jgi:flagellar basal body rod protein FlgG